MKRAFLFIALFFSITTVSAIDFLETSCHCFDPSIFLESYFFEHRITDSEIERHHALSVEYAKLGMECLHNAEIMSENLINHAVREICYGAFYTAGTTIASGGNWTLALSLCYGDLLKVAPDIGAEYGKLEVERIKAEEYFKLADFYMDFVRHVRGG